MRGTELARIRARSMRCAEGARGRSLMRFVTAFAVSAGAACSGGGAAPDVGTLDPVYARAAEDVEILTLRSGETLGGLLGDVVDSGERHSLLLAFRERASPRRIRAGTEVTLRYGQRDRRLRAIDVALNGDETVRLVPAHSGWRSETIRTPTYVDTLYTAGEIETSLWNALIGDRGLASMPIADRNRLIDHLDRVFQWQVDFYRQIRAGDTYRFAFEREVRPDGSMRGGRLLAAELVNAGTPFHAIWFDPNDDGEGSYYDLDGKSVRRAFLLKPLEYRRISSRFSGGRFHPMLRRWRAHRGVDYAADTGTPIMATADGVVRHRGPKGNFGNAIEVQHPNGFITRYAHLSGFRKGVSVGSRVRQGETIGYVGMTGLATGPHLHYEMIRSGRHVDPLSVDLPSGDPVPEQAWGRWSRERAVRAALIESIPGGGGVRMAGTLPTRSAGDGGG